MNIFQCAKAYVLRKPMKSIILCIIFTIIFLGELIGIGTYSVAKKGEEDAFRYLGPAISIESEDGKLTDKDYDNIASLEHVKGVNNWNENRVTPVDMNIVKEYTGVSPDLNSEGDTKNFNSAVLLALMNTELYSWFRYEKAVSLISGVYPSYENQGILIESRFAKQNGLNVGDDATFVIEESGDELTYKVCGIFQVDSDFVITDENTLGDGVFILSPYNVFYINYEYASETIGFESRLPYGCSVFVDKMENVDKVGVQLRELLGEDIDIYNVTSGYLSNEVSVVTLMKNYSFMILGYVSLIGCIIMLLVLTFYASQYRRESAIFIALGYKKRQVILQYGLSMLLIIIVSFLIAGFIYFFTANGIIGGLANIAENIAPDPMFGSGPYEIPNLGQGFSLEFDMKEMISLSNYLTILFISLGFLLISMVIPLYSIITTKPKFLLDKK